MKIIEVNTPISIKEFHQIPFKIYQNDKNWIPHIERMFNNDSHKEFVLVGVAVLLAVLLAVFAFVGLGFATGLAFAFAGAFDVVALTVDSLVCSTSPV